MFMTDFTKTKIVFAIALLATLFTLSPLLKDIGKTGFNFLGVVLEIRYAYYIFSGLLSLAVYLYAFELITEKPLWFVQKVGNIMYAFAILVPMIYLSLYAVSQFGLLISIILKPRFITVIIEILLTSAMAILGNLILEWLGKQLSKKDKSSSIDQLTGKETTFISRANELFEAGHYDLSVVESFKAIETSLRKLLIAKNVRFQKLAIMDMLTAGERAELISKELSGRVNKARSIRNQAAHAVEPTSRETATEVIQLSQQIISELEKSLERLEGATIIL